MKDGKHETSILPLHNNRNEEETYKAKGTQTFLWRLMLLIGVLIYGSYSVLVHLSKERGHLPFNTASVIMLVETVKLLISFSLYLRDHVRLQLKLPRLTVMGCLPYAVPAVLYTINNNVSLIMLLHMDPTTYQVLTNLKIATTAILYKYIIKREITSAQWVALGLLMLAGATDSYGGYHNQLQTNHHQIFITLPGLLMMLLYCSISGLAAVYTEYILKKQYHMSLHLQNSMLYLCGISFNSLVTMWQMSSTDGRPGFFTGFSVYTWLIVVTQAMNGLIISIVMKHGNNLTRLFIISGSMLISTFLTMLVLGTNLNSFFLVAAVMVILSLYLYHK